MGVYKNVLCSWFLKTGKNPKIYQQERSTVTYARLKWKLKRKTEGRMRWSNRRWDGWTASPTQWTWVWANFGRRWRTGKPGVLQSMGSQRVRNERWQPQKNKGTHTTWMTHRHYAEQKNSDTKENILCGSILISPATYFKCAAHIH